MVYLNRETWTREPDKFTAHVMQAMDANVGLLVLHEACGLDEHVSPRGAVAFQEVLEATNVALLERGIYHMIAISLKAGEWRKVSHVMVLQELASRIARGQQPGPMAAAAAVCRWLCPRVRSRQSLLVDEDKASDGQQIEVQLNPLARREADDESVGETYAIHVPVQTDG